MTLWLAVAAACVVAYLLKLSGYLLPERTLEHPVVQRVSPLLPVALLASLVLIQSLLTSHGTLTVDARAAGLAVAVIALLLRAPFLVVIVAAALTTALLRAMGG